MAEISGAQINEVLRLVKSMTPDGDAQLSILGRAFVVGCKSCGVDADSALAVLAGVFREAVDLASFDFPTGAEERLAD